MSTDPPSTSPRIRYLLPSTTDLIFVLLLIAFTYGALAPRLLWDGDIGWHIRNGQNILASHAIPRTDSFSATKSGQPWYSWEWLFDLLIAIVHRYLGLNGVVLVAALIIATTVALVFRIAVLRGGWIPITIVILLVGLVAASIHFLARPHIVTWLMAVVWFRILDGFQRGGTRTQVWLLPGLMLLWVNLHGGFVLGFALLGIFLLGSLIDTGLGGENKSQAAQQARVLALTLIGCGVVSLVNPYGYRLHVHIYRYLTNRFYMQHIEEFRAPGLRGLPAEFFVLLLALAVAAIVAARFRLHRSDWLLIAFSAFSGLWAARNIPIASMVLTMIIAPLFSRRAGAAGKDPRFGGIRFEEFESRLRGHVWPSILVLITVLVCLRGGNAFGRQWIDAHFDPARFPVGAVDALAAKQDREPIFSLDSWGGYLIYRRYPEQKVLVDDRHDFYGEAYLREYLKVLHLEPGWEKTLDDWRVKRVVFPTKSKLGEALRQAGWQIIYADHTAAVFSR